MKIGVLIKTVKFVYAQTGTEIGECYICPDDIIPMVNPLDEIALEYALELKDQDADVTVTAISLGDRLAVDGLRKCLAMGADEAVHIPCEFHEKLDPVSSSAILAAACQRRKCDLILCGASAIDDNEGLEGPYVAGRLGIPHVSGVVKISPGSDKTRLEVHRVVERGDRQLLECAIPALMAVRKGTTVPRYPTLSGFLRAKAAPIAVLAPEELGFVGKDSLLAMNVTEKTGQSNPKPKIKAEALPIAKRSAAQRLEFMIHRDALRGKGGGKIVEGTSEEMFSRLDGILLDAGILKR